MHICTYRYTDIYLSICLSVYLSLTSTRCRRQVLSLNQDRWEQLASPLDRFAKQHCPGGLGSRCGSQPGQPPLDAPDAIPASSPLNNLVRQNFPRRGQLSPEVKAPRNWGARQPPVAPIRPTGRVYSTERVNPFD